MSSWALLGVLNIVVLGHGQIPFEITAALVLAFGVGG
jgi:hypothetical protein